MSDSQHHTLIDPARAHPAQSHRLFADPFRWLCIAFLRMTGWKVEGSWPPLAKAVLVAAPHTSNWDGVYMLAAAGFYRVKLRWMGKQSLTTGPLGPLVRWLGCVPIDRANRRDMVASMAATFSPDLADLTIYVISVCQGEEIPRKGGPGITRSDLLIINKQDLAPHVGVDLEVMRRDADAGRKGKPTLFTDLRHGQGVEAVVRYIERHGGLVEAA